MMNFYPGPSQLFHSVRDHFREAFKKKIGEMPPNSRHAAELLQRASQQLRLLLSIPDSHAIFFLPSSELIRERIAHDLVQRASAHVGQGEFSHRLHQAMVRVGKSSARLQISVTDGPPTIHAMETDLIAITHTEDTGAVIAGERIEQYAKDFPGALIAVDASCALPYAKLPYHCIDTLFLDFHFGFGLPPGLAAWIVNEKCIERHNAVRQNPAFHDSVFSISNLWQRQQVDHTADTISLMMVATLNGVLSDMLSHGIATIRRETEYKAALLYHHMNEHPLITPAVADKSGRSRTIIAADCGTNFGKMAARLKENRIVAGPGKGNFIDRHFVFANFPTHSREQYERLADILTAIV